MGTVHLLYARNDVSRVFESLFRSLEIRPLLSELLITEVLARNQAFPVEYTFRAGDAAYGKNAHSL
jgi:hypothetical protein